MDKVNSDLLSLCGLGIMLNLLDAEESIAKQRRLTGKALAVVLEQKVKGLKRIADHAKRAETITRYPLCPSHGFKMTPESFIQCTSSNMMCSDGEEKVRRSVGTLIEFIKGNLDKA